MKANRRISSGRQDSLMGPAGRRPIRDLMAGPAGRWGRRRRLPVLEGLEGRTLLSGSPVIIYPPNNSINIVNIYVNEQYVEYTIVSSSGQPQDVKVPTSGVSSITAYGRNQVDTITVVSVSYNYIYNNTTQKGIPIYMFGGSGLDTITGGPGDDWLQNGTAGIDSLQGGGGNDTYNFNLDNLQSTCTINDSQGDANTLDFSASKLSGVSIDLSSTSTQNVGGNLTSLTLSKPIQRVNGTPKNDTILGNSENNYLWGFDGDDTLTGGGGNDTIVGGSGTDTLIEAADTDFTLTDTSLTRPSPTGQWTDTLNSIGPKPNIRVTRGKVATPAATPAAFSGALS